MQLGCEVFRSCLSGRVGLASAAAGMENTMLRKRFWGLGWARRGTRLFAPVVSLSLLLATAVPLLAHGLLKRSAPANGAQVMAVPRELRLTFSEPVDLAFVRLELVGPSGAPVPLGELHHAGDSTSVVTAGISGALTAGTYAVSWQAVGRDGHPTRGRFSFVILADAEGLVDDSAPRESAVSEDTVVAAVGGAA